MKIKKILIILLSLTLTLFVGCEGKKTPPLTETPLPNNQVPDKKAVDPILERMKNLSLEEKIGQLLIVGLDSTNLDDNTKDMIATHKVGGFILFQKNISNASQCLQFLNSLKEANKTNKIPLFLSVDEEGGRVSRMPKEISKIPSAKYIGGINNPNFSNNIGAALGETLKGFGFNVDFAPVLDVATNPKNTVIGDRSYSSNEKIVSKLGIETMRGLQSKKVISVIKHFPGHGNTSVDSHIGLPKIDLTLDKLKSIELIPFKDAIENGADMVMVGHILLPNIDSQYPSSLSKTIISGVLRKDLNFNGVVITDDLTMGAISKTYSIDKAAVTSLTAGSDIALVCSGYDSQIKTINAIKKAIEDGILSMADIDSKVYRILKLKDKYSLSDAMVPTINVQKINETIKNALNTK